MTNSFLATRARRGFTLVEMLIVIAVIGLLAAIAFPVFSKARESGRRTACLSNLKQLGLAFQQYTQDSGGRYPASGDGFTAPSGASSCFASTCFGWKPGKTHWVSAPIGDTRDASFLADPDEPFTPQKDPSGKIYKASAENGSLFPYAKSASVYYCPSDQYGTDKGLSYSMNCALTLMSEVRIRTPIEIVLLVDEQGTNDGYFWAVDEGKAKVSLGKSTDQLTKRHNGGGNLLFADGHVKFFPFETFPLDHSAKGLANKWKTAGAPRFHDRAFGPLGSNRPSTNTAPYVNDYCDASAGPGNDDGTANVS